MLASFADGVHIVSLEEVVEAVKLEAFVQEFDVHLLGEAHQADCLVFDLGYEGFVLGVLGRNEFCNEIFAIRFRNGF